MSAQRLAAAADQERAPVLDDDATDADDGPIWIFACQGQAFLSSGLLSYTETRRKSPRIDILRWGI